MKKVLSIMLAALILPLTTFVASASTIQVVFSHDGPVSDYISIGARDAVLSRFIMTADGDITVENLDIIVNANGEGLLDGYGNANFTDFKIVEIDSSGAISSTLMGPLELDLFGSDSSQTLNFGDYWDLDRYTAKTIAVTCDVRNYALLEGVEISADLEPVSTTDGIRDRAYGDYVSDILPVGTIYGNLMTIGSPTLDISLASTPVSDTIASGETGVNVVSFVFTAGEASDVVVTDLTLAGYIDENEDSDYSQGVDNSVYVRDVITSVWLEDASGIAIAGSEAFTSSGDAFFTGMNWLVEAGCTQTLKVYADVSVSAPYNFTDDAVHFDIDDASYDVVVVDADGNTVTATGDSANGWEDSPYVAMTVANIGTLALSENSVLSDQTVASGTNDVWVGSFKITSTVEDFEVNKMTIAVSEPDAIKTLTIEYPTDVDYPLVLDGSKTVAMSGVQAVFTVLGAMVPADDFIIVNLYVDLGDHTLAAGGLDSGDAVVFTLDTTTEEFDATGQSSGVSIDESDVSDVVTSNTTYVYRSVPTFANVTSLGSSLSFGVGQEVYRFSVTADSSEDIVLGEMAFDIFANGVLIPMKSFYITEYGSSTVLGTGRYIIADGIVTMSFSSGGSIIGAGGTKIYSVYATVRDRNPYSSREVVSMKVHQDSYVSVDTFANVKTALGGYGTIWSDYGSTSGSHGVSVAEWMGNYAVPGMPMSYMRLS